jgi:mono/diheme cytochrome c family protein
MKKAGTGLGAGALLLAWSGWILLTGSSTATLPMQKKAKELGFPAENCAYCHGEKMPKKGAATYNERGKWLIAEKEKRKASEVDPVWLKDYPGDKK